MPQPKKGARLGANPKHQAHMLSNLAASLFIHERIKTTEAKAKTLRPLAEKLITKAKKGDVHNRRQVLSVIEDRDVVHKLFDDIGPRFSDRNGGYTRILKIGPRQGDGAPMVLMELVEEGDAPIATTVETPEGKKRRIPGRRRRAGSEDLPQDKPVRSKAAEAWAVGQAEPLTEEEAAALALEAEGDEEAAEGDELAAEAQADEAEAVAEAEEVALEAESDAAEEALAEGQADAGDAPDAGSPGTEDQK